MAQLKKREKIMLAAAGFLLVVFVLNQFVCVSKTDPPIEPKKTVTVDTSTEAKAPSDSLKKNRRREKPPVTFVDWVRDPFSEAYRLAQFDTTGHDSSDFVLRGVIRRGNESYVLIGDAILKQGQSSGDLTVVSIRPDQVVCRKGNRLVTLVLSE